MITTSCFPQTQKPCYALIFFTSALITATFSSAVLSDKKISTTLYCICYCIPHIMTVWETALLIVLAKSVANKLSTVHDLIKNHVNTYVNLKKVLPLSKPALADKFLQRESSSTVQRFRKIMEMHLQLTSLSVQINDLFELPILITAAHNFVVITFCVYFFCAQVANAVRFLTEVINIALYCIILAAEIIVILVAFQGMQEMVGR